MMLSDLPWKWKKYHFVIFQTAPKYYILGSFFDYESYSISSKGILPIVVDIVAIWI